MSYKHIRFIVLSFMILVSLSFVCAAIKTAITVDFLEGSRVGDFRELGFYTTTNGGVTKIPLVSGNELRNIEGYTTYVVDGRYSLSQMYVKGIVNNGVLVTLYTEDKYNSDKQKHFSSGNSFYWFDHLTSSPEQCVYDDFGFTLLNFRTYDVFCSANVDCGVPSVERFCQQDDVYKRTVSPLCEQADTEQSYCSSSHETTYVTSCPYGCSEGACNDYVDHKGPTVDIESPVMCSMNNTQITVSYVPHDDSAIKECYLVVNAIVYLTDTTVDNNSINVFTRGFIHPNQAYTVEVSCYDINDNFGKSTRLNVSCDDVDDECTANVDCGSTTTDYFCSGDTLLKSVLRPTCEMSTCSVSTDESVVRTCSEGCLNGHCVSDKKKQSSDETCFGESCEPIIIQTTYPLVSDSYDAVFNLDNDSYTVLSSVTHEDTQESTIPFFMLFLIIGIIILVVLIFFLLFQKLYFF